VIAKAHEVLALAAYHNVRNLLGLADNADSETVRLAATNSALDRAGLGAKQALELSAKPLAPWEEILQGIAMEVGRTTRAEYNARYGLPPPNPSLAGRADDRVVDAELVREQEPPISPPSAAVGAAGGPDRTDARGDESATRTAPVTTPRILTQDEAAAVMRSSWARTAPVRRKRRRR
jgi:hypothetical protein